MPRKPRFILPGVPQHVIQRGNDRAPCFRYDSDYRRYLDDLCEFAGKHVCQVHAYVLMTNHVHLLVTPTHGLGISQMMQDLGRKYVQYFNRKYDRTGTLWEGRFKACIIDSDNHFLTCMRYIELNPVRATMVAHPGLFRWSSYSGNALGRADRLLTQHPLYMELGATAKLRQCNYRRLFNDCMDDTVLREIRDALNRELAFGRSKFKDTVAQTTKRPTRPGRPGRPRIEETSTIYDVSRTESKTWL